MDYIAAIMFILPQAKWKLSQETMPEGGWKYEHIIWEDLFYPKPTEEELIMADKYASLSPFYDYRIERLKHYPTAEQQLQMIFDYGVEGWKERIQNVKNNIPKPSLG